MGGAILPWRHFNSVSSFLWTIEQAITFTLSSENWYVMGRAEKGFESWTPGHTGRVPVQSMTFTLSGRDQCVPGNTPSYIPEGSFHQRDCVPLGYFFATSTWASPHTSLRLYCLSPTHSRWFTKKLLWGLISVAVLVVIVWFRLFIPQSTLMLSVWFKKSGSGLFLL